MILQKIGFVLNQTFRILVNIYAKFSIFAFNYNCLQSPNTLSTSIDIKIQHEKIDFRLFHNVY